MKKNLALMFMLLSVGAWAQNDSTATSDDLFDMSLEQLLNLDLVDRNFYLYGYINSNFQKTFDYPSLASDGSTMLTSDPVSGHP